MTDQPNHHDLEIDPLGDDDAVAMVYRGRDIEMFLTVRHCQEHGTYAIRLADDQVLGGAEKLQDALFMADLYLAGYINGRGEDEGVLAVARIIHRHDPFLLSRSDLEDLRN
jgi:hypothetical protein